MVGPPLPPATVPAPSAVPFPAVLRPGDVFGLPEVTFAVLTVCGRLRMRRAPGRAVWTVWDLPDQADLRAELRRQVNGGDVGGGLAPCGALPGGLTALGSDVPAVWERNPVAERTLELLGLAVRVRGPVAVVAHSPHDPVTDALTCAQRARIVGAFTFAKGGT